MRCELLTAKGKAHGCLCTGVILLAQLAGALSFDLDALSAARFPIRTVGGVTSKVERLSRDDSAQQTVLSLDWKDFHRVGTHGLAFRYRFRQYAAGNNAKAWLIIRGVGEDGVTTTQGDWKTKILETGERWADYYLEDAGIRRSTKFAQLVMDFADDLGCLEIKDIQGIPGKGASNAGCLQRYEVETRLLGLDAFDGVYHLAQHLAQSVEFDWRIVGANVAPTNTWTLTFALPKGVELASTCGAKKGTVKFRVMEDGTTIVSHGVAGEWLPKTRGWKGWKHPLVYVRSALPPGTEPGPIEFTVQADGRPVSAPLRVPLRMVETVKAHDVPKRFRHGVIFTGPDTDFDDPSGAASYAQTLIGAGVRYVRSERPVLGKAMDRLGKVGHIAGAYHLANGFIVNTHPNTSDKRPPNQRFVSDDPNYKPSLIRNATCPVAVYEEDSYFRDCFLPNFRSAFAGRDLDIVYANWEPNPFLGHGCMCTRCRDAFVRFSQLPNDEVAVTWPSCVTPTGRYAKLAMAFRAVEHGKLVKTLARRLREITRPDGFGFVPGIVWTAMTGQTPEEPLYGEIDASQYVSELKCLCPWGPYVWWYADRPYFHEKRLPIAAWASTKTIREHVDSLGLRDVALWGLVSARQGECWEALPEWLEMGLDSYFFNRWSIVTAYFMPNGYDARWWKAYANAVTRAAKYEDYVLDGKRVDEQVSAICVPEYATPCKMVTAYLPAMTNVTPLVTAAFDWRDARIVAALNFWDRGDAYLTLRCHGLKTGEYVVVDEDGTLWAKDDLSVRHSAEELERGIFVRVNALSTRVFEIQPAERCPAERLWRPVSEVEVRRQYEAAREDLRKAAEVDREEEKGRTVLLPDGLPVI